MCAAPNSSNKTLPTIKATTNGTKPIPKWLKMKQQNLSSAGKTAKPTAQKSSGAAQKPVNESRNAKRARWAKKSKPVAKPVVKRGPEKEYISVCCSSVANKPKAGAKEVAKDPETGKMKDKSKGLGHWRCGQCGKPTKVTPRKPEPKVIGTTMSSCPDIIFPAKLHTPVVTFGSVEGADMGRGSGVITSIPLAPEGAIARVIGTLVEAAIVPLNVEVTVEEPKAEVV